jgi:hypothetical protein
VKLPNGDQAIAEDAKLSDYVLNPFHPVGKHHARLFASLLGIERENSGLLKNALLKAAAREPILGQVLTPFGCKYEMSFDLFGPRGTRRVRAVWVIESGSDRPRLVTCYVE